MRLTDIDAFPRNIEMELQLKADGASVGIHLSIAAAPAEVMEARIADDRVGFFSDCFELVVRRKKTPQTILPLLFLSFLPPLCTAACTLASRRRLLTYPFTSCSRRAPTRPRAQICAAKTRTAARASRTAGAWSRAAACPARTTAASR